MLKVQEDLRSFASHEKAAVLRRFFKTGRGEYGEGDVFIGVKVPETRSMAKKHAGVSFEDVKELLSSEVHEDRLCGLLILVEKFKKAGEDEKEKIFEFYMENLQRVNNWDLVDVSAYQIAGGFLESRSKEVLYGLSKSENVWERRVSIISTFHFIRKKDFEDTIKISEVLLHDSHGLIHKAVGWMLREMGKRDEKKLLDFLDRHSNEMPRTMLRYAIERLPGKKRAFYMGK